MAYTFTFTYNSQSITAEVITDTFQKTEILYSGLKQADNSARFQCVFTTALSNFLKANINNDVKAVIKDGSTKVFTGYIRKTITFNKTQVNEPIELEIVSPSYFLDKTIEYSRAYINQPLSTIVSNILSIAGTFSKRSLTALSYTPQIVTVQKDDTVKNVLTELLYEYGYVWDFDNSGYFEIKELFNQPETESITNTFDGSNILDKVTVKAKENDYDCIKATYNNVEELENGLIFHDTTGAGSSGAGTCLQPVKADSYFADKKYNYLDCDNTNGSVIWIESITPDILKDSGDLTYTISYKELDAASPGYNQPLGTQLCFTAKNNSGSTVHNFTKLDVYGHVWIAKAVTDCQSFGNKKTNEITLKYICDDTKAQLFTQRITNWYRFANNEISLSSKENYQLGGYVKISETGIGTYYGRIIKKVYKINTSKITYTIETIEGYTPAEVQDKTTLDLGGVRESSFNAVLSQAQQYTDAEIAHAEMQASPIYEAVFDSTVIKKSTQGEYTPSTISARGRAITGDDEEENYIGIWSVYINEQTEACYTLESAALSIGIDALLSAASVDEIQSIKVDFKSRNGLVLIDTQNIPVISGAAAYSIVLQNPFQTYEADETGTVTARTVTTKARVFYGLQELQYLADDGWEYGIITAPSGFSISVNATTGEISITSVAGNTMPDVGQIEIPVFIHSQTNTEMIEGYEDSGVIYYSGYDENFNGYLEPDENGYYYTYFSFQKLTANAIKIAQLSTTVNNYWNEITNDRAVTEPEKNALSRLMDSITGEYAYYSGHYTHHQNYTGYAASYSDLLSAVNSVLETSGTFFFDSEEDKEEFNSKFETYYSEKATLDNEVATKATNNGGISDTDDIDRINPKPGDYFAWTGNDNTSYGALTLRTGLVYSWTGTAWAEDHDNEHIMATMPDVMTAIQNSTNEQIPAIALYKQVMALKVIANEIISTVSSSVAFTTLSGKVALKADKSDLTSLSETVDEKADKTTVDNKADKSSAAVKVETYYKVSDEKPTYDASHTAGWSKTKYTGTSTDTHYWYATRTKLADNNYSYGTVYEDKDYLKLISSASDLNDLSGTVDEKADKTDALVSQLTYYKVSDDKPVFNASKELEWSTTKYTGTSTDTHYWYAVLTKTADSHKTYGEVIEDTEYFMNLKTKSTADTASTKATNAMIGLDRKRNVFTSQPTIPYYKGDLWLTSEEVEIPSFDEETQTTTYTKKSFEVIYYSKVNRYSGSFNSADWDEGNNLQDAKLKNALTKGKVTAIGGYLNADVIDVDELFAKNIEATNMHLKGNSTIEGEVNATSGIFNNVTIKENCGVFGKLGAVTYTEGLTYDYGTFNFGFPTVSTGSEFVIFYSMEKYTVSRGPSVITIQCPEVLGIYFISWSVVMTSTLGFYNQKCKLVKLFEQSNGIAEIKEDEVSGSSYQYVTFTNPSTNADNCKISKIKMY